jgi:hypothetical protein
VLLPRQVDAAFADKAAAHEMTIEAQSRSRVLSLRHAATDPARAAAAVNAFLRAQAPQEMLVIDEASVPFASLGSGPRMRGGLVAMALLLLVFSFVFFFKVKKGSKAPDREVVRYALRFAQLGQKTLIVDTGTRFRVVLSGDAAATLRPDLQILASLAGGALIVARTR